MNKVIKNGEVAVLYSPGYGAGWYSWHNVEELLYDPTIVEIVARMMEIEKEWRWAKTHLDWDVITKCSDEHEQLVETIEKYVEEKYGEDIYCGGAKQLMVAWLPVGTKFRIDEYDGSEGIEQIKDVQWMTA